MFGVGVVRIPDEVLNLKVTLNTALIHSYVYMFNFQGMNQNSSDSAKNDKIFHFGIPTKRLRSIKATSFEWLNYAAPNLLT